MNNKIKEIKKGFYSLLFLATATTKSTAIKTSNTSPTTKAAKKPLLSNIDFSSVGSCGAVTAPAVTKLPWSACGGCTTTTVSSALSSSSSAVSSSFAAISH